MKYYVLEGMVTKQMTAFAEFGHYLNESMTVPKVWIKEDDSQTQKKPTNLPETVAIVTLLITRFGFTEQQAWNMPFSKAIWYATSYAIQEGGELSIITTDSEEREGQEVEMLKDFEKNLEKLLATQRSEKKVKII